MFIVPQYFISAALWTALNSCQESNRCIQLLEGGHVQCQWVDGLQQLLDLRLPPRMNLGMDHSTEWNYNE
jgi:hypothetical protein